MPDKSEIKIAVLNTFKGQWYSNLNNVVLNPILRTYKYLKTEFRMEPHLNLVTDLRYRKAITKLRASSHTLEIERGRYTHPKTPLENRLCHTCNIIKDEIHFLVGCRLYAGQRAKLFVEILNSFPEFQNMDDFGKFVFMLSYPDPKLLTIVGKFIHNCFHLRDRQWFILTIEGPYPNVCVSFNCITITDFYVCMHVLMSTSDSFYALTVWMHMFIDLRWTFMDFNRLFVYFSCFMDWCFICTWW